MEKKRKSESGNAERLSREEWLSRALDVLAQQRRAKLRIDELASDLGVSKGSFYWHFVDRADFVRSVVEYWAAWTTETVIEAVEQLPNNPRDRLFAFAEILFERNSGHYEVPIRALAAQEAEAARIVKKVDQLRYNFVRSLFAEAGFSGQELEMRTTTFVVFHNLELAGFAIGTRDERSKLLRLRHEFFTRP